MPDASIVMIIYDFIARSITRAPPRTREWSSEDDVEEVPRTSRSGGFI